MNPLLFFIFICAVASICFVLGHQIGYLGGKAEVSDIPRGEPPNKSYLIKNEEYYRERPPASARPPIKKN